MTATIQLESIKISYREYIKALEISRAELISVDAPFIYFNEPVLPLLKTEISMVIMVLGSFFSTAFILCLVAKDKLGEIL